VVFYLSPEHFESAVAYSASGLRAAGFFPFKLLVRISLVVVFFVELIVVGICVVAIHISDGCLIYSNLG
jgi:hypothetical protein